MKYLLESKYLCIESVQEQLTLGSSVYSVPQVTDFQHFLWKHINSPNGPSLGIVIRGETNKLIGRALIQPRIFFNANTVGLFSGVVVDLIINPKKRDAQLLIDLTRQMKSAPGFDLIFHTSNEVSDLIYQKLFKFPIAFMMTGCGFPLAVSSYIKRNKKYVATVPVLKVLEFVWKGLIKISCNIFTKVTQFNIVEGVTEDLASKIFRQFKYIAGPHLGRDLNFLDWRFKAGPLFKGDIQWVSFGGEVVGFFVTSKVEQEGLKILAIMDVVFKRQLAPLESLTIKLYIAVIALKASCDAVFTLVNASNPILGWLGKFPYIPIPNKYLPHATPIFIHSPNVNIPKELNKNIFFTLADLDYF